MDKEEYVVHHERIIYFILIIVFIIMIYTCYWAFTLDANDSAFEYRDVSFVRICSFLGMIWFSLAAIVFAMMLFGMRKNNQLIVLTGLMIDIYYNHPYLGVIAQIAWEEITDIKSGKAASKDWAIDIYYTDKNIKGLSKKKKGKKIVESRDGVTYRASVLLTHMDKEPEEVIDKIFEYWENYKKQTGQPAEPMETIKTEADIVVENPKMEVEERETAEEDELDLMEGVLEAADSKNYNKMRESIEIKRNGKNLFNFKIHSLSREEISKLDEKYTAEEYSLQKIYLATIDEEKIWDDEEIQNQLRKKGFSISTGIDVIQAVLEENEIKEVNAKIDEISGIYASELSKING